MGVRRASGRTKGDELGCSVMLSPPSVSGRQAAVLRRAIDCTSPPPSSRRSTHFYIHLHVFSDCQAARDASESSLMPCFQPPCQCSDGLRARSFRFNLEGPVASSAPSRGSVLCECCPRPRHDKPSSLASSIVEISLVRRCAIRLHVTAAHLRFGVLRTRDPSVDAQIRA